MLRFTVVIIALVGACVAFDATLNPHWASYKAKHGKSYSRVEEVTRRSIFERNVQRINAHNLNHDLGLSSFRLGLNQFADMTNQEFLMYKGLAVNATQHPRNVVYDRHVNAPASVDWRTKGYVTGIKDQGQCGSCWAFSTTGSLEGQHFAKTGKLVSLSEQNLVDCSGSYGNNGCGGGLMDNAFKYIKANGGIDTEASYPYTAQNGQCRYNTNSIGATCTGFVDVAALDESALQSAVATVGPVSVAIDASHNSFQLYKEGVYDEPACSSELLDHGVLAVGYGTTEDGKDYWIVKNSWGTVWGQKGYIQMSRNKNNQCGIATQASYPTV